MTRATNARVAGIAFLLYIGVGVTAMATFSPVENAGGIAAQLNAIAGDPWRIHLTILQYMAFTVFSLVLATTLYALTKDEDRDIATLGFSFRAVEGALNALGVFATIGLFWLATGSSAASLGPEWVNALGTMFFKFLAWLFMVGAWVFAVGSLAFCYLFFRSRSIPLWIAGFGLVGSVLLVVGLPLQLLGFLRGAFTDFIWAPMAVFEVVVAFWFIFKGVVAPRSL